MESTAGEFRWALAPDLAAWSSDRDREAMPNIRQRRPAMEQAQLTRNSTDENNSSRIVPVGGRLAAGRGRDDRDI